MDRPGLTLPVLLFFFAFSGFVAAQEPVFVAGEWLVKIKPGAGLNALSRDFLKAAPEAEHTFELTPVAPSLHIWLLRAPDAKASESQILDWLRRRPEISLAQYNHIVAIRSEPPASVLPNDPFFNEQWQYINNGGPSSTFDADLDAEQAWEYGTGGITPAGDTIVIAVIDGGISQHHPDLEPNLWVNRAEIPNDGLDNDQNGYKDDHRGWNVWSENDQIEGNSTTHGTPVSGIIGAVGNNGIGVTGVNWKTKIMFVAGKDNEASILEAYEYVLRARKVYNESNGAKGAFVVAVNCSWGVDGGQPSQSPLWCAAFDSLGAAGIVSVAATANQPVNVDEFGDLPTTCPSEYLISVTSLNRNDEKAPNAAWGIQHIDLGTYGHGVFTTASNNAYATFEGTSFAAPHVSGAIGLLYSAACPGLVAMAKTEPSSAAVYAKSLVLQSVTPIPALQNKTLTGGRLNLNNLLEDYKNQCSDCQTPFALNASALTQNSALFSWHEGPQTEFRFLRWRLAGDSTWTVLEEVTSPLMLDGLLPCHIYEFSVEAFCAEGATSGWSPPFLFSTDGCCDPPIIVNDVINTGNSSYISWPPTGAANAYQIRIKVPQGDWGYYQSMGPEISLGNLFPCTLYEIQVRSLCDNPQSAFSPSFYFTSAGCGPCIEKEYCTAEAASAASEWIASVAIGPWVHETPNIPGSGYQDFTQDAGVPDLELSPFEFYPLEITPAFLGSATKQFYRVYIDLDGNGLFDESEIMFDPGFAHAEPATGWISIPGLPAPINTRMRVMMKFKNDFNSEPLPCETFDFGQVEDYCVTLKEVVVPNYEPETDTPSLRIAPVPSVNDVRIDYPIQGPATLDVFDAAGHLVWRTNDAMFPLKININNWPTGVYVVRARAGERVVWGRLCR